MEISIPSVVISYRNRTASVINVVLHPDVAVEAYYTDLIFVRF